MKTLADLKRDLKQGTHIKRVWRFGKEDTELLTVDKVQTTSIRMTKEKGGSSWLEIPKASLMEYDGKQLKIYSPGKRDLTSEEQKIKEGEPKDIEQDRIDMMTDGSQMHYRRMRYYKDSSHFYLFGTDKEQGKRLTWVDKVLKVEDDSLKGELTLVYEVMA